MTDEELNALVDHLNERANRMTELGSARGQLLDAAASAIRQLMRERDEAFQEGQRDMQFAAAKMTNDPAIFAKIYDLEILTRPLKRS